MGEPKNTFILYKSYANRIKRLSMEQRGQLFTALLEYQEGNEPELDPAVGVAFDSIIEDIKANDKKYEEIIEIRRENGRKGGEAKARNAKQNLANVASASFASENLANVADKDKDKDKEEDKEQEEDKVKDKEQEDDAKSSIGEQAHHVCAKTPIPYADVVDAYNAICTSYPRITGELSKKRKDAIRARFNCGRTMNDFLTVFHKAQASNFLKGANDRNWSAKFDWLIQDGNFAKVLDGNYDNRAAPDKGQAAMDDFYQRIADWAEGG